MGSNKGSGITKEAAAENARKQITAVVIAGIILLIIDLIISFSEKDIQVMESGGQLYVTRPMEGQNSKQLMFKVKVVGKKDTLEKKMGVTIKSYDDKSKAEKKEHDESFESTEREQIESGLRNTVLHLNSDRTESKVKLPDTLDTGQRISWEIQDNMSYNAVPITILIIMIAFFIYKNRFAMIEKQKKKDGESVIRQLPEFVNRLVLLLNAGLVLTSAFEKSIEESFDSENEGDYFYRRLREIYTSCKTANGSMHSELKTMAKECGVRELMRVSNIINDNVRKGVQLTDKLHAESELLWLSRKKACEERGRLAETKLTLPLMIFLMVLIVITIAPALLEL